MNSRLTKELGAQAFDAQAAMDSLARLLATRQRSVHEAHVRLLKKGYDSQTIAHVLQRALACELLNDQRFARSFIKDKLAAGWGRRRVEQELHRFGITVEEIEGYPDEYFSEDEQLERALLALRRHHSQSKNPRQAAYRFLIGRGYSSDVASAAIRSELTFSALR